MGLYFPAVAKRLFGPSFSLKLSGETQMGGGCPTGSDGETDEVGLIPRPERFLPGPLLTGTSMLGWGITTPPMISQRVPFQGSLRYILREELLCLVLGLMAHGCSSLERNGDSQEGTWEVDSREWLRGDCVSGTEPGGATGRGSRFMPLESELEHDAQPGGTSKELRLMRMIPRVVITAAEEDEHVVNRGEEGGNIINTTIVVTQDHEDHGLDAAVVILKNTTRIHQLVLMGRQYVMEDDMPQDPGLPEEATAPAV
nr:hypothetical protein Iba_chr12cCG13490 [Ipomoea batatas]